MASSRYKFDDLGWHGFESLCQSLLLNKFALGIQAWGGSGDYGRDAYYEGCLPLPDPSQAEIHQSFVFQAKFVSGANATGARSVPALQKAIKAELARISTRPVPDTYVLMSNVPLTTATRVRIEHDLQSALPNAAIVTWGSEELAALLDKLPELRNAFPQLLSLRDLKRIIDDVVHRSSHTRSLSMLTEESFTFVRTAVYRAAQSTLKSHSMVVLAGPPEMGKTTLAFAIALEQATNSWQQFSIQTPKEFMDLVDRKSSQVFVADDAFGSTEYRPGLADEWASELDAVLRRLDLRHWLIFTSRAAPLEAALAKMHLQGRAEHFPTPGRISVNATALTQKEKALMLYMHAKHAKLEVGVRDLIRANAETIVESPHFTPKRVQRFVRDTAPSLEGTQNVGLAISEELSTATNAMHQSFNALPQSFKTFLVAALDGPDIGAAFDRHKDEDCIDSSKKIEGLLSGHFIVRRRPVERMLLTVFGRRRAGDFSWTHPSWRDLLIEHVATSSLRRRRFLERCGVVGFELALSTGGGALGERERPFLCNDGDWQTLGDRLPTLVRELNDADSDEVSDLLAIMHSLLTNSDEDPKEELLNQWSKLILKSVCTLWTGQEEEIPLRHLKLYWDLSECVHPLCAGPDMRTTWESWVSETVAEIESPPWNTEFPATMKWIDGAQLLKLNEPRFLRQVDFPASYQGLAEKLTSECEEYLEHDPDLEFREDYDAEIEQLEAIVTIATRIGLYFDELHKRTTSLATSAVEWKTELEERLIDHDIPDRWKPHESRVRESDVKDDTKIDIKKLFSDL